MAGPTRVLLVDDDPSLADLMANQLGQLRDSFSIRVETDPNDALEVIEEGEFDCVVSDYHMPEMTGIDLLRYVREMEPNVPFILFTARGSEEIASEAVSEGVTDYFRKTRGSEQWRVLANRIENVAARYRAEEAVRRRETALRTLARTVVDSVAPPIEQLLDLGRSTLEFDYAAFVQGDGDDAELLVECVDPDADVPPISAGDLTVDGGGLVAVSADHVDDDTFGGFTSFVATPVYVGDRRYGTLCLCDEGVTAEFSPWERAFVELLGNWLGNELTSEWARDQSEAVRAAQNRLAAAEDAIEEGDEDEVRAALEAVSELLDRDSPSSTTVSIELTD